jgi:hypothetical protein
MNLHIGLMTMFAWPIAVGILKVVDFIKEIVKAKNTRKRLTKH